MTNKYEIKPTGQSAYKGPDIGIYEKATGMLVRTFNSLSNDYAHTCALEHLRMLESGDREHIGSLSGINDSSLGDYN